MGGQVDKRSGRLRGQDPLQGEAQCVLHAWRPELTCRDKSDFCRLREKEGHPQQWEWRKVAQRLPESQEDPQRPPSPVILKLWSFGQQQQHHSDLMS